MRKNEWTLQDIEDRGGAFIRKQRMKKTRFGSIYAGSLHFDDIYVEVMVQYYPMGGAVVYGPANFTIDCLNSYRQLLEHIKKLKTEDVSYRKTVARRKLIDLSLKFLLFVNAFLLVFDAAYVDFGRTGSVISCIAPRLVLLAVMFNTWIVSKRY